VQLVAAHAFDLLDDVLPVHLVVHALTVRKAPQQLALSLAP
jgi:hypothetical protein